MNRVFLSQTSMAHTRWATHGVPSPLNCHPHVSDAMTEFSLVHSASSETRGSRLVRSLIMCTPPCRWYHHKLCVPAVFPRFGLRKPG
jgi:hypothetical protein